MLEFTAYEFFMLLFVAYGYVTRRRKCDCYCLRCSKQQKSRQRTGKRQL